MHHTLQPGRANLHAHFSRGVRAVLTIESGDTVVLSTPDVSWGLEPPTSTTAPRRKVEPRDPARDNGPCMVGPVAVRGAEPGDALEIVFERIVPAAWGWTYSGGGMATPAWNAALGVGGAPLTLLRWMLDHAAGEATNDKGDVVRLRPFMGTVGLCPDEPHASGWVPRVCGGNMDCREVVEGSTLLLPVMVPGGMLSLGDGHAAQGDGEVSGTAIECAMEEVRLRVTVRKGVRIAGPRVRTPEGAWVTLGFGETLDGAAEHAVSGMLDVMEETMPGRGRAELLALASSAVSVRVTQVVNPLRGVHAVWKP
ncbi:MAG TPA: acetamidase/formamidase family protein [Phycisphaerales bacterium]|nr:acetamidase/formamidase family protein [Phycisphaerales bacterium]